MKNLSVYYSLEGLNSFVDQLKDDDFKEFSFEDVSKWDGDYVLFSFTKDSSKKVSKLVKVMDKIPLPYIINPYMDNTFFTILCFVLKYKLDEVEIYGHCHVKVISGNQGLYNNNVIISNSTYAGDRKDLSFFPALGSFYEVFKSIKGSGANNLEISGGKFRIFDSNIAKTSLKELLLRFNCKNIK